MRKPGVKVVRQEVRRVAWEERAETARAAGAARGENGPGDAFYEAAARQENTNRWVHLSCQSRTTPSICHLNC